MRIRLRGSGHAATLLAELNRCRQSRQFCDVFLQVGNRTFAAHRAVLACAGTYFLSLFARTRAPPTAALSLEFISPANFEKVLTFIYTGEILTDLIDVGVLYEMAERLGVTELVRACHATFPDLRSSSNGKARGSVDLNSDPGVVPAAASASCSSATSCSSLSSPAAPTPAAAPPSPLFQTGRTECSGVLPVKTEVVQSHAGYEQIERQPAGGCGLPARRADGPPGGGPALRLKSEKEPDDAGGGCEGGGLVCDGAPSESSSFPDTSAPAEASDPTPSGEPAADGEEVRGDGGMLEEEEPEEERWRPLAVDIIELSDEENFMEEGEEEEDDLVCLENGEGGASGSQVRGHMLSCNACAAPLRADPEVIRGHALTHLTELGLCKLCGASISDRAAGVTHTLTHVGVQLFTCDMCHLQFCSQNKLLRHHRQAASAYGPPRGGALDLGAQLQCVVCSRTLSKDFQTLRDHLLSHMCPQSLSCTVCHLHHASLCSLLWHAFTHLSVSVSGCPHCARCFTDRALLDRHVAAHAEEAAAKERELRALRPGGAEDLHCFLCPETFCSTLAFQYHLDLHSIESTGAGGAGGGGPSGKRKAEQCLDGPGPLGGASCCPSSFPGEPSSLARMGSLGLGLGLFPGATHSLSSGVPADGGLGHEGGAGAAAAVRGKWYRCRYCGKRFAHSGEFTYHLRIHTGEKPYQCKVCLRFFRGRSTMICHLKTHAGALMYRCTVCGLYFSTLKSVSSHMELHKDQLPADFAIEQTFMYNDHSKEPLPAMDG